MTAGPHRIRRQSWQVRTDSPAAALALRTALRSEVDGVLARAFERAFDALGLGDRVLHLPRLVLSIRLRPGDDFVAALAERVERELTDLLRRLAPDGTGPQPPRPIVPAASWREVLLAYLRDGAVPWHAVTPESSELLAQLREAARALVAEPRAVVDLLGATADDRFRAGFRLVQLLEPAVLVEFLKGLAAAEAVGEPLHALRLRAAESVRVPDYPRLRAAAIAAALRASDLRPPRSPAVAAWLGECATKPDTGGADVVGGVLGLPPRPGDEQSAGRATAIETTESPETGGAPRRTTPPGSGPAAGPRRPAEEADPAIIVEPRAAEPSRPAGEAPPAAPSSPTNATRPTEPPRAEPIDLIELAVPPVSDRRPADEPLGLLVPHAGLVLLHPFLPQLFGAVGLRGREPALPTDRLPRAAALLHWLAAGTTGVYEFELPLVKVLLGLAPDYPVPAADGLLTDADRAEGDALLAAVIEHWAALGKTSVDGLRGSFLRRRGLLRSGDRGWQLRMETESFDVLLGRLPWAVGVVKLPWMPTPMFIDWPTP
jgi:hypothetical protein